MGLEKYNEKRDFNQTPEPAGKLKKTTGKLRFVVQRHEASSLHYDFRLEMEGVLKSWAVPKGPSLNPADKRLAMEVEDHPFSYRTFEGEIPEGNYGAGCVAIWDEGTYYSVESDDRETEEKLLLEGLKTGSVKFMLEGAKLRGEFALVKMKGRQKNAWLLLKKQDENAVSDPYDAEDFAAGSTTGKKKPAGKAKSLKPEAKPKAAKPETKTTELEATAKIAKPEATPKTENRKTPEAKTAAAKTAQKTVAKVSKNTGEKSEMPHLIKPMMAKLTDAPFDSGDWIFETKWDGFRAVAEVRAGKVELYSRSGKSYGNTYQPILESLQKIPHDVLLDGEIVVLNKKGFANFQELQNYQNTPASGLYFSVFDLLFMDGEDLRQLPLIERKERLKALLPKLPAIRYSEHIVGAGKAFFKQAQENNIEGIMAKLASSPYRTGQRSTEWLKIKTHYRQEVVIGGFTEPKGSRKHIGALLMGVYENGKFTYVGQSGSGFNLQMLEVLKAKLDKLVQAESPFAAKVKSRNVNITWVKPELVAEITFAEWTKEGIMRQAIYEGLRTDKKPKDVVRENAVHATEAKAEAEETKAKTVAKASKK